MPTTTNYGWTTPADTDLVKDGASAIRTLGSSIDSTVFSNASAGIAKTIVDAKGDLIAGTASDTVARLAVGSNDQVLMADSTTATGLKWGTVAAGGQTLLSTTTLSGASTTISSISQSYKDLILQLSGGTVATGGQIWMRVNGISTSSYNTTTINSTTVQYYQLNSSFKPYNTANTGYLAGWTINIPCYSFSSQPKSWQLSSGGTPGWDDIPFFGVGMHNSLVDPITSITLISSNGQNLGGTLRIYGVS